MPPRERTECLRRAERYAWDLSARYFGCPVYLVGSALRDPDPRDIDLVVRIPDDLFEAMYQKSVSDTHEPPKWWILWSKDCAKESRWMTMRCLRTVDFTVQSETMFRAHTGKRRRIACVERA